MWSFRLGLCTYSSVTLPGFLSLSHFSMPAALHPYSFCLSIHPCPSPFPPPHLNLCSSLYSPLSLYSPACQPTFCFSSSPPDNKQGSAMLRFTGSPPCCTQRMWMVYRERQRGHARTHTHMHWLPPTHWLMYVTGKCLIYPFSPWVINLVTG